jgi:hypothetical protein
MAAGLFVTLSSRKSRCAWSASPFLSAHCIDGRRHPAFISNMPDRRRAVILDAERTLAERTIGQTVSRCMSNCLSDGSLGPAQAARAQSPPAWISKEIDLRTIRGKPFAQAFRYTSSRLCVTGHRFLLDEPTHEFEDLGLNLPKVEWKPVGLHIRRCHMWKF